MKEIDQLRSCSGQETSSLESDGQKSVPIPGTEPQALDVVLTLEQGTAAQSGILLRSWMRPSQEGGEMSTQALLVDWQKSTLEVAFLTQPLLHLSAQKGRWNNESHTGCCPRAFSLV